MGQAIVRGLETAFHPFLTVAGCVNFVLHVCLYALLVAVFFFTYASLVEGVVVERQTAEIVDSFTVDLDALAGSRGAAQLRAALAKVEVPTDPRADAEACAANRTLRSRAFTLTGCCAGAAVVVALGLWGLSYWSAAPAWVVLDTKVVAEIFVVNVVILVFVAATEWAFLTFVGANYRSADPNKVKLSLVDALRQYAGDAA